MMARLSVCDCISTLAGVERSQFSTEQKKKENADYEVHLSWQSPFRLARALVVMSPSSIADLLNFATPRVA
jgi:hypothetical protein